MFWQRNYFWGRRDNKEYVIFGQTTTLICCVWQNKLSWKQQPCHDHLLQQRLQWLRHGPAHSPTTGYMPFSLTPDPWYDSSCSAELSTEVMCHPEPYKSSHHAAAQSRFSTTVSHIATRIHCFARPLVTQRALEPRPIRHCAPAGHYPPLHTKQCLF